MYNAVSARDYVADYTGTIIAYIAYYYWGADVCLFLIKLPH